MGECMLIEKPESAKPRYKSLGFFPKLYAASGAITFLLYFFAPHYLGINLASGLIFNSSDGWCVGTLPIFGPHCFGDFGQGIIMVENGHQVWTPTGSYPPGNYPAAPFAIYAFFRLLLNNLGYAFTIFLYLGVLAASTLIPIWFLSRQYQLADRIFLVMTLGIFSVPFLAVIDRGNTTALLIPCILLAYTGARIKSEKIQTLGIVLAVLLRPQAILLVVIFVIQRKYLAAFKAASLSLLMNLFIMFAWDHSNFTSNLKYFYDSLVGYGNKSISADFPYNYSLARGIYKFIEFLNLESSTKTIEAASSILGYFLIGALLLIAYAKKIEDFKTLYYLVLVSMFLLAPVTYVYYTVLILLTVAITIDEEEGYIRKRESIISFRKMTLFLFGMTLTPFYVPSPVSPHWNLIQISLPLVWVVWILYVAWLLLRNKTRTLDLNMN